MIIEVRVANPINLTDEDLEILTARVPDQRPYWAAHMSDSLQMFALVDAHADAQWFWFYGYPVK